MSHWRAQHMVTDSLRAAIKGVITLAQLRHAWPKLRRHLCDTPRKRRRRTLGGLTALCETAQHLS